MHFPSRSNRRKRGWSSLTFTKMFAHFEMLDDASDWILHCWDDANASPYPGFHLLLSNTFVANGLRLFRCFVCVVTLLRKKYLAPVVNWDYYLDCNNSIQARRISWFSIDILDLGCCNDKYDHGVYLLQFVLVLLLITSEPVLSLGDLDDMLLMKTHLRYYRGTAL